MTGINGKLQARLVKLRQERSEWVNNNAMVVAQAANVMMQYNQGLAALDARINEIELIIGKDENGTPDDTLSQLD